MNEYRSSNGTSSTSKSRSNLMKSPSSYQNVDPKTYKKKYERKLEELMVQKQRTVELQRMIEQMTQKLQKQEKELQKKEQIEDVLLMQITQLKTEINSSSKSNKTSSKENSIEESNRIKTTKRSQQHSKNSEFQAQSSFQSRSINGYNFTLSQTPYNQQQPNEQSYQSDYSQNSYQKSAPSNYKNFNSSGQQFSGSIKSNDSVGGYMKKVFNL